MPGRASVAPQLVVRRMEPVRVCALARWNSSRKASMTALGGIFCRQRKAVALGFYRKLLQHNALTAESRAKRRLFIKQGFSIGISRRPMRDRRDYQKSIGYLLRLSQKGWVFGWPLQAQRHLYILLAEIKLLIGRNLAVFAYRVIGATGYNLNA
jgi:hypothetical protein